MATADRKLLEVFPPGDFLQEELDARGWLQTDFAAILGKNPKTVSEIISGKRSITPEMAMLIGEALGTDAAVWLNLESAYQIHKMLSGPNSRNDVSRKARIYQKYPIREMTKRGWLSPSNDLDSLEDELKEFFSRPQFPFAARRSDVVGKEPLQTAWLHRAYNIARDLVVESYSDKKLARALKELTSLLMEPREIVQIPRILAAAGIRFLVVEQLPASGIDGVCFWLDAKNPVVALTLRWDRIDNFWFTLIHELQHVKYGHGQDCAILDVDIMEKRTDLSDDEKLADKGATEFLIPCGELENFIARVSPLFSERRIRGFARRIGVHPGIVVGQLQYRDAIPYTHHRKNLVKVKELITATAPHDGWGTVA